MRSSNKQRSRTVQEYLTPKRAATTIVSVDALMTLRLVAGLYLTEFHRDDTPVYRATKQALELTEGSAPVWVM